MSFFLLRLTITNSSNKDYHKNFPKAPSCHLSSSFVIFSSRFSFSIRLFVIFVLFCLTITNTNKRHSTGTSERLCHVTLHVMVKKWLIFTVWISGRKGTPVRDTWRSTPGCQLLTRNRQINKKDTDKIKLSRYTVGNFYLSKREEKYLIISFLYHNYTRVEDIITEFYH